MPTTTSPLTPATHGLRVAASFNPRFDRLSLFVFLHKSLFINGLHQNNKLNYTGEPVILE